MDELDLWIVRSLIQSKGCRSGELYQEGKDRNLLLQLLLTVSNVFHDQFHQHSAKSAAANNHIFIVDGGTPELFVLTGLKDPVIWYSKNFIAKHLRFREIIMSDEGYDKAGLSTLFETLGEFYLSFGNESFSKACFLQSLIEAGSYVRDEIYYESALADSHYFYFTNNLSDQAEAAMVALYLGIAHEIGHTYRPTTSVDKGMPKHPLDLSREKIKNALVKAGGETLDASMTGQLFGIWKDRVEHECNDPHSPLSLEGLRSEIEADWAGLQILTRFMEFAYRNKRPLKKKIFVAEILIGLFNIQLIEQCKYIAKHMHGSFSSYNSQSANSTHSRSMTEAYFGDSLARDDKMMWPRLMFFDIQADFAAVHRTRIEFLKPTLRTIIVEHLFPDTFSMQHGIIMPTVPDLEVARRESVASTNLENYLDFYFESFARLLAKFEDVLLFATHMFTDTPPEARLNTKGATSFAGAILSNFQILLTRLNVQEESNRKRKQDIYVKLKEYVKVLEQRGVKDNEIMEVYYNLGRELGNGG
jgi:hypothetical protein